MLLPYGTHVAVSCEDPSFLRSGLRFDGRCWEVLRTWRPELTEITCLYLFSAIEGLEKRWIVKQKWKRVLNWAYMSVSSNWML
jgi:hypothetical protein